MNTPSRWLAALAGALTLSAAAPALASDLTEVTRDVYEKATEFERILREYPKVAKLDSEKRQIAAVARDKRWRRRELAKALETVRSLDGELTEVATKALEEAFEKNPRTKGRIVKIAFDTQSPENAVLYVRWRGSKRREVDEEAATIAAIVKDQTPFVGTLSIAAIHPSAPEDTEKTVWEGVISRSSMDHISLRRVDTYADSRYKGMFTDHKSVPF